MGPSQNLGYLLGGDPIIRIIEFWGTTKFDSEFEVVAFAVSRRVAAAT